METGLKFQGRRRGHCGERESLPAQHRTVSPSAGGCLNSFRFRRCEQHRRPALPSRPPAQGGCNEGEAGAGEGVKEEKDVCPNHFDDIAV